MAHIIIRHKVKDYTEWKTAFDGFLETRRGAGEKSFQIFHSDDDPNNVWALFKWDSLDNARMFMASTDLKEAMGSAGVLEQPDVYFLEDYDQGVT